MTLILTCCLLAVPNDNLAAMRVAAWPGYRVLVWQYQTPPPGPAAVPLYQAAGLAGLHLDDGFPDALLAFAKEQGWPYYVDHAAGKGDLYLRREQWAEFHRAYKETRGLAARPNSLHDPAVFERMTRRLRANLPRAMTGPVLAYAFDDEISMTSFTAPVDLDWSEWAQPAFRAWLAEVYGDVATLNRQWQTSYTSFAEAEPLPVDALLTVHRQPFDQWNLSRWADHRTFCDVTFAEVLGRLRQVAAEFDPDRPAGFVGGQAPAAYGGFDYGRLTEAVDFIEAYDLGGTNEILRSLMRPGRKPHVQTFFSSRQPAVDKWFFWYYFVHGNRGAIAWPAWGETSWFAGGRVHPSIAALRETLEELQGPLAELLTDADFRPSPIALYYSQPSIQVSWFMDIEPHRRSWINRSSSLNNGNATDIWNRWAWLKLLEDAGYQAEFVTTQQVLSGGLDPARFRALILPRTLALSAAEAEAVERYHAAGGAVLADYLPAVFDQHGRGRASGALDRLFHVARDPAAGVLNGTTIAEVNGEKYQQPWPERLSWDGALRSGELVLYERGLQAAGAQPGLRVAEAEALLSADRTLYLNLTPLSYLLRREPDQPVRQAVAGWLAEQGIAPIGEADWSNSADLPPLELLRWRRDREGASEEILAVVANPLRSASVDGFGDLGAALTDEPAPAVIRLTEPCAALVDLRTGERLSGNQPLELSLRPSEARLFRLEPTAATP